ncbi:MAG: hypothetical protein EOL95_09810 [Bacteroidia bacterium]|nr:hypothetical protein [Bacteroidia bacterium]
MAKTKSSSNDELFGVNVALRFADASEVSELLTRYGYSRDSVTPELVLEALKTYGASFGKDLADLARKGANTRTAAQQLAAFKGLVYADGVGSTAKSSTAKSSTAKSSTAKSSTAKSSNALGYVNTIFDFLGVGVTSAASIVDSLDVSGAKSTAAQAALIEAQNKQLEQQGKNNTGLYLAIGGVGLLLVGVVVFMALRKR